MIHECRPGEYILQPCENKGHKGRVPFLAALGGKGAGYAGRREAGQRKGEE